MARVVNPLHIVLPLSVPLKHPISAVMVRVLYANQNVRKPELVVHLLLLSSVLMVLVQKTPPHVQLYRSVLNHAMTIYYRRV